MAELKDIVTCLDREWKHSEVEDYPGAFNGLQLENSGSIERVIAAVRAGADGAIPGVSVTDTIKVIDTTPDGTRRVGSTPERSTLVAVQTPQAFRADRLREAHRVAADARSSATDDAALVEGMGGTVVVIEGSDRNRKITSPEDLVWARAEVGR